MAELKRGWLARQLHMCNLDIAIWPEYMRREAGFTDDGLSAVERKTAADILRRRADELDPPCVERKIDRAYVHGYEQASREWFACLSDSSLVRDSAVISDANVKRRTEALAAVRRGRA